MNLFRRTVRKKTGYGEDESVGINWFNVVLLLAAGFFMCSLLTVLLWPVLFGDEPDTIIVPYGGDAATTPPLPTITAAPPTAVPITAAPQITAAPSIAISANTATQVNRLFDVDAGNISAEVSSVAFSADGVFLAAGSLDGTVRVWQVTTVTTLFTFRSASNRINSIAFAPNGRTLVGGGQDNVVRLWDLGSGQETQLTGPNAAVREVAYSPDGTRIAAASDDGVIYVWNTSSGTPVLENFLGGLTSYATSVAFSPDGRSLAAGSEDDTIRVWDVQTGATLMVLSGHTATVTSIAFSPDGGSLVSTSADKTLRLWNLASATTVVQMQGHTENLNDVAYTPDGTLIASAGGGIEDNTVRLWNPVTGAELRFPLTLSGPVNSVAFSADGRYLAAGGATYLSLWAVTGQQSAPAPTAIPQTSGQGGLASCTLTVRGAQANQRTGPGLTYTHTATLVAGQQVQAVGWATSADDGYTWWQLNDGTWVRGDAFIDAANPNIPQVCLTLAPVTNYAPPAATAVPAVPAYPTADTSGGACLLTVQGTQANQRTGPGLAYTLTNTLAGGQQVQATGWASAADGYTWWRISDGTWVRGDAFISAAVPQVPTVCLQLPPVTELPALPAGADAADTTGGVCTLTVRQPQATLRSGPAESYTLTGTLNAGQQIQASGWASAADGFTWWRLVDNTWMRGDAFLDAANTTVPNACLGLPLITDLPDNGATGTTGTDPTGGACILTVRQPQATIYNGPGETYAQAGVMSQNQQVQADGYAVGADGFTWWRFNALTWARGDVFLDAANPDIPSACLALPLVAP